MFKTDKNSLDKLSFIFNEGDIARFASLFEIIEKEKLSTLAPEEHNRLRAGLTQISKLKLNGKIYIFHVEDAYALTQNRDRSSGVELYLRQGDRLENYLVPFSRDRVYSLDKAIEKLNKDNIRLVYTGPFRRGDCFLGLNQIEDNVHPIERTELKGYEIEELEQNNIKVVYLDSLI